VRERKLFNYRWKETLKGKANHSEMARGFVDRITIFSKRFAEQGEDIFDTEPVRVVKLADMTAERGNVSAEVLALSPNLARLRGLDLTLTRNPHNLMVELTQFGNLKHLRELTINSDNYTSKQVLDGLIDGQLNELEAFILDSGPSEPNPGPQPGWTSADFQRLARWPGIKTLKKLILPDVAWTVENLEAFAALPFGNLEQLDLSGQNFIYDAEECVGTKGLKIFAKAPGLAKLKELTLVSQNIDEEGAKALAESPTFKNLRRLQLYSNPLGLEGIKALINSPHIRGLYRLNVDYSGAGGDERLKAAAKKKFPDAEIRMA
jgi:hypothetical protein